MSRKEASAAELRVKFPKEWKELQALALKGDKEELPKEIRKDILARAEKLARGEEYQVALPDYGMIVLVNLGWMEGDYVDLYIRRFKPAAKMPRRFGEILKIAEEESCDWCDRIRDLTYKKLREEVRTMDKEIKAVVREIDVLHRQYDFDLDDLQDEIDQLSLSIRDNL